MLKSFSKFINESRQELEDLLSLIDAGVLDERNLLEDPGLLASFAEVRELVNRVELPAGGPKILFSGDIDPYEEDDYTSWRGPAGERIVLGSVEYNMNTYAVRLMLSTGEEFRSKLWNTNTWDVELFAVLGDLKLPAEELTELYRREDRWGFGEIILPALSSLALRSMLQKLRKRA